MATVIKIEANLEWRAEKGKNPNRWIAFCDSLGISTEAASLDELHNLIPETMHLLMVDLLEDNELDDFLNSKGWAHSSFAPEAANDARFNVPWHLRAEGTNDFEKEAC